MHLENCSSLHFRMSLRRAEMQVRNFAVYTYVFAATNSTLQAANENRKRIRSEYAVGKVLLISIQNVK